MLQKKKQRIVLSAGGTAGHLVPAHHLAEELTDYSVSFVAGNLAENRFFQHDFPWYSVSSASWKKNPLALIKTLYLLCKGWYQSISVLRKERPCVVIGFGSFVTFPVLLAALCLRIEILLHEQNRSLGIVNALFAPFASGVASYFPLPLKKSFCVEGPYLFSSRKGGVPTVLIMGGSQGSLFLNDLILRSLDVFQAVRVVHIVGAKTSPEETQERYDREGIPAKVLSFEPNMDQLWPEIHFAITRAGASTLMELITFEVPALLIPFPHARRNHQRDNARFFVETVRGGLMQEETMLTPAYFMACVQELILHKEQWIEGIQSYKKQRTTRSLADYIRTRYI